MPRARTVQISAPVQGLNSRDSVAALKPDDAMILDNLFPDQSDIVVRGGSTEWASGLPGAVESLMEWASGSRIMWAASSTGLYNITAGGAVGASAYTTTSARFQSLMFTNTGGAYLCAVNGADGLLTYNGTTWTAQTVTGMGAPSVIASWKRRLWLGDGTSTAYYLGTDAIAGAAQPLPLGGVWRLGGTLAAVITTSFDNRGTGLEDFVAFMSTNGEAAIYQGTDPTDAAYFQLAGVYRFGAPVGSRASVPFGGDAIVLTTDGLISMSEQTQVDRAAGSRANLSERIKPDLARDVLAYGNLWGWQVLVVPQLQRIIVNVPTSASTFRQYVLNAKGGAWCRFTGLNARCWGLFGDRLLFGGSGVVVQAETGTTDDGAPISWAGKTAFNGFGNPGNLKRFVLLQALVSATDTEFSVDVDVDYGDVAPASETTGASWALLNQFGRVASVRFAGEGGAGKRFNAFQLVFEPAGGSVL